MRPPVEEQQQTTETAEPSQLSADGRSKRAVSWDLDSYWIHRRRSLEQPRQEEATKRTALVSDDRSTKARCWKWVSFLTERNHLQSALAARSEGVPLRKRKGKLLYFGDEKASQADES